MEVIQIIHFIYIKRLSDGTERKRKGNCISDYQLKKHGHMRKRFYIILLVV